MFFIYSFNVFYYCWMGRILIVRMLKWHVKWGVEWEMNFIQYWFHFEVYDLNLMKRRNFFLWVLWLILKNFKRKFLENSHTKNSSNFHIPQNNFKNLPTCQIFPSLLIQITQKSNKSYKNPNPQIPQRPWPCKLFLQFFYNPMSYREFLMRFMNKKSHLDVFPPPAVC